MSLRRLSNLKSWRRPEWCNKERDETQIGIGRASSPRKARGLCSSSFAPPFSLGFAPGTFLYCWRTMSCCGNPRPQVPDKIVSTAGTRSVPIGGGGGVLQQQQQFSVSEQPAFHPGIISPFLPSAGEASSFRPPDITTPPLAYSMAHLNGTAHSPPPTASSTMHSSIPPSSPQMGMYPSPSPGVDPNGRLSPLRRPTPTYPASGSSISPNLLSTYHSSAAMSSLPPIDEGKVSVSIDFGERRPSLT